MNGGHFVLYGMVLIPKVTGKAGASEDLRWIGEVVASGLNTIESVNFDPALSVHLKELDFEVKKQENVNLCLKLRVVEVETDREDKLHTLVLGSEEMSRKPIPLPRSRPPSVSWMSLCNLFSFLALFPCLTLSTNLL